MIVKDEALIFLKQDYENIKHPDFPYEYKHNKEFILKSLKINKFILFHTSIFNTQELKDLIDDYFKNNINEKDKNGFSCLTWFTILRKTEIIEFLLKYENIDVNIRDKYGSTALICASAMGHYGIVKLLLDHPRIDVNIKSISGKDALMYACEGRDPRIIKLLKNYTNE